MKTTELKEKMNGKIDSVEERIMFFIRNDFFNPYTAMTETESKAQRIYRNDVDFLFALEELIEKHDQETRKIVFNNSVEQEG